MRALGLNLSKQEVKKIMKSIDTDDNGYIDEKEFKVLMTEKIKGRN